MIRIRGRRSISPEISQVSMSDVAFLLLIFFLSTTIFDIEFGLPMVLPGLQASPVVVKKTDVLTIRGQANGRVLVDGVAFPLADVGLVVAQRMERSPELICAIETEGEAEYGTMVGILDAVRKAGVTRVSLRRAVEG